ncbi:MAG: DUF4154 domain-containing protein [Bacteroidales bacterium]|nr:DUF4154 domain-containing protein [Bacteroidales bacterium]
MKQTLLLIFIWLLTFVAIKAQYNESRIKVSLIFGMAEYITWPSQPSIKNYNIGLLTTDSALVNEFRNLSERYTIKGLPVTISVADENKLGNNFQILFIGTEYSRKAPRIAERTKGRQLLLISDNCEGGLFSMIDFYMDKEKGTLAYKVNRQNLDSEGFLYTNDLLLHGGSLVDLKELYKATSEALEAELYRLKHIQAQNTVLISETEALKNEIEEYRHQTDSMSFAIQIKENNLETLIKQINEKELLYLWKQQELLVKIAESDSLSSHIREKDMLISGKNNKISALNDSIKQKQQLNTQKDIELFERDRLLEKREKNTLLLLGLAIVFLFATFLGFRGYRVNKILNVKLEAIVEERTAELEKHKNHLELLVNERTSEIKQLNAQLGHSNKELTQSNLVLEKTNLELIQQRSEISALNNELVQKNEELNTINEMLLLRTSELEDALKLVNETKNQLIQSEKMASLGLLAAGIAHEINNPVNFINAGIQALQRIQNQLFVTVFGQGEGLNAPTRVDLSAAKEIADKFASKSNRIFDNMADGVERINLIVQSLSNYSQNEGESVKECDIAGIIRGTLVILHNKYKGRIVILQNYPGIPKIHCMPGKIGQLFMNLISNAIDAIQGSGTITITGTNKPVESKVVFSIKDTGTGIPKKIHKHIFDPFYTTKEVGKGTGLGLYISYGIVEQHGGTIEVKSEPGMGAEFIVTLPYMATKS